MFIYRLFENRKGIKNLGNELKKAFPDMSPTMIFKVCRDYCERQGDRKSCFVISVVILLINFCFVHQVMY